MYTEISFNPGRMRMDGLHSEFERSMNTALAEFVADIVRVKGAGDYSISASLLMSHSDRHIWRFEARTADGRRPGFPYPGDWGILPEWANFWTVSAIGQVCWHESQPELITERGVWASHLRMNGDKDRLVDIPLGIDWRTLCFQRPTSVIAQYKMAQEQARQPLPQPQTWGVFEVFKKFLP